MNSRSKHSRFASVSARSPSPPAGRHTLRRASKSPVREQRSSSTLAYENPPELTDQLSVLYSRLKSVCPTQSLPNSPSAKHPAAQRSSPSKQFSSFSPKRAPVSRRSSFRRARISSKVTPYEQLAQPESWEADVAKTSLGPAKQRGEVTATLGSQYLRFAFRDEQFYTRLSHFYAKPCSDGKTASPQEVKLVTQSPNSDSSRVAEGSQRAARPKAHAQSVVSAHRQRKRAASGLLRDTIFLKPVRC